MLMEIGRELIDRAYHVGALRLEGGFDLSGGRVSPYFFNGKNLVRGGRGLVWSGDFFLRALEAHGIANAKKICFNAVCGPAYGAIPFCLVTSYLLNKRWGHDTDWMFDRKEEKGHGEGGLYVGAEPREGLDILLVEDTISSGQTIKDRIHALQKKGARVVAVFVLLDREEGELPDRCPSANIENAFGVRVYSAATFSELMAYLEELGRYSERERIREYRKQYGFF